MNQERKEKDPTGLVPVRVGLSVLFHHRRVVLRQPLLDRFEDLIAVFLEQ